MKVTAETVAQLEELRKTNLEADVVRLLAERKGLSPADALELYYESDLARMVEANAHGVLYLDAAYLVDQAFGSE